MNRIAKIILSSSLILLSACSNGGSSGANGSGNWAVDSAVDDFGDAVEGSYYVKTVGSDASFSNTATTDDKLSVVLFDTPSDSSISSHIIYIRLLEYNDTPVTYLSSSKINVNAKIDGETVEEFRVLGEAPNSDLMIGVESFDGDKLHYILKNGSTVKFVVTIDNSKYSFTIDGKGLEAACSTPEMKPLEDAATANYEKNTYYPGTEFHTIPFAVGAGSSMYNPYDYSKDAHYWNVNSEYYHSFGSYDEASLAVQEYEDYLTQTFGEPEKEYDKTDDRFYHRVYTDSKGNKISVTASTKPAAYVYLFLNQ